LSVVALAAGCTFAKVKPSVSAAPLTDKPSTLVVGDIRVTDESISAPEADMFAHAVRFGIGQWIQKHGAVLSVVEAGKAEPEATAITVTGNVHQIHKGSKALRFWVGMGAGQAKMEGEFTVTDAHGNIVNKFTARRSYLGGSGMGGWDMVSMDDLGRQLGQSVGETIAEWVAGKNLEQSSR
jgi:hypothetical protein